jgi:hypothetical protein
LLVSSDEPCALTGTVAAEEEPGYGPSYPKATTPAKEQSLWFLGLLPETTFHYILARASKPDAILAEGEFTTPALPWWTPRPKSVTTQPTADVNTWVAMIGNLVTGSPEPPFLGRANIVQLVDRQGRVRFFHETLPDPDNVYGQFLEGLTLLPEGWLAWSNRNNIPAVGPTGDEVMLFDIQLTGDYAVPTHHWPDIIIQPGLKRALAIFNLFGPGLECDYETPTDMSVGDGIALLDESGVEMQRWTVFQHTDSIPPTMLSPCGCDSQFWGPGTYDFSHMNHVQLFQDATAMLLSSRNFNMLFKVDVATGDVVWKMGRGGDFEWIGVEPEADRWFYNQHSTQWLDPNHIILFDNSSGRYIECDGNTWSRALELEVDEVNMTVRRVWEHRTPYGAANGTVTRMANGNTMIFAGWSNYITEVTPAGEEIWVLEYPVFLQLPNFPGGVVYPSLWVYPTE